MAPPAADAATTTEQEQHAAEGEGVVEVGGDLRLVAECGTEVRLSRSAARMSTMLLGMIEAGCADGGIPINGADVGTLRLVAAYCEKHAPHYDPVASAARLRDPFPPFPIEFTPPTYAIKPVTHPDPDPHGLEAWDHKFISDFRDNSALFNLIIVSKVTRRTDRCFPFLYFFGAKRLVDRTSEWYCG
jgi:S-phase kinase-associated protein 1